MLFKQLLLLSLISVTACSVIDSEKDVPLSDVPEHILSAAKSAVEGFVIEWAELETESGIENWELEGRSKGKHYEIEISKSGEILEVEENQ